ncbi:nickel-dependent hydrogenase large subunit, partial [Patescibacteria group bacterium]|nr:nickel-dependent hydrogenase large subunit [Patescibacteria group bacterium]
SVKLNIHEGERLFEGILVGRTAEEAHWITPRICGVCPIAHNLASLYAVEDAYGIKVSEGVKLLRKLMICGQMIQSHVLHLFFLVLPDYIGIDRGTELAKKKPASFKKALSLKELGDEIAHVVAGRNVHPVKSTVGGFHQAPTKKMLEDLLAKLVQTEKNAEWTVKVFSELKYPEIRVDLELVAQSGDKIVSNAGKEVLIKDYKKNIEEELRDYSTAKFGKFQGREMFVGALARLAVSPPSELGGETAKLTAKLNFQNPFHNNIAQAIEILQYHKQAHEIIEKLLNMTLDVAAKDGPSQSEGPSFAGVGIGAVEAPRGGLYHEMHFDPGQEQRITYANIITPTVQNLTSIEKSASALLEQIQGSNQERQRLLNMLVRAYDPCITCSVH